MQKIFKIELVEEPFQNYLEILNDLYLPLIGEKGVFLYVNYLMNKNAEVSYEELLKNCNISSDELFILNKKMNSIQLIKIFESSSNTLIKLFSPKSGYSFLSSVALKTLFISSTNEATQKKIFSKYLFKIEKNYKEIIYNLNDAFAFDIDKKMDNKDIFINMVKNDNYLRINGNFSIAKCFIYLKKNYPNLKIEDINEKDIDKIIEYSNLYGINERKIASILSKSIKNDDGYQIDFNKFNKEIDLYLKYDNKVKKINEEKETLSISLSSNNGKLIEYYLNTPPLKLIADKTNGIQASKSEKDAVKLLKEKYSLSDGLINVINDYLLSNYGFININYAEDFARRLKRNNIDGVFEALDFLLENKEKSNKKDDKIKKEKKITSKEEKNDQEESLDYLDIETDFD